MNCFNGVGRLTRDSELKYTAGTGTAVLKFTLAIDRDFKNVNGETEADFLGCTMFNKSAESLCQYLVKGKLVAITGRVQTGSYEAKDGSKRFRTGIVVRSIKLLDRKKQNQPVEEYKDDITPVEDGDIPF